MKKSFMKRIPGFSLIEVSIVLLIIGIMLGAVIKGRDLVEQAKIRSAAFDFSRLQTAVMLYTSDYGNDIFDNGIDIWEKLYKVSLLPSPIQPQSKIGGSFTICKISDLTYITLGKSETSEGAFLTASQVKSIHSKLSDSKWSDSSIIVKDSSGKVVNITDELSDSEKFSISVLVQ